MVDEDLSETCEACGGKISTEAVDQGDVLKSPDERFWHEDCPTGAHEWTDRRDAAEAERGLSPGIAVGDEVKVWVDDETGAKQSTLGSGTEPRQNERQGYRNKS